MSLYPGRRYVGDTVRLAVNWQNEDGTDIDPSTDVLLSTYSPSGTETEYTYSDNEVIKSDSGNYYYELQPDESGRWHYKWEATGTGTQKVLEGSFVVMSSVFEDDPRSDYS